MESRKLSVLSIKLSLTVLLKSKDLFSICDLNVPICVLFHGSGISVEPHDREHVCWIYVSPGRESQGKQGKLGHNLKSLQPLHESLTG